MRRLLAQKGAVYRRMKNIKEIIRCDLVIEIFYIVFAFSIGLNFTNTAELLMVTVYTPALFLYPLVICPWLGFRLRDRVQLPKKDAFFACVAVFLLALVLFCTPVIPLYTRYSPVLLGCVTLLPAIGGAVAFYIAVFKRERRYYFFELKEFYVYAIIILLLLMPGNVYTYFNRHFDILDPLLLFGLLLYYPILFLTPLVACPIFGRLAHRYYMPLPTNRKGILIAAVFFILLFIFSTCVDPPIFSKLLWDDYRQNFYLCVLAPAAIGAGTFGLALCCR